MIVQAQKPDFVFRRNGRVHLNTWGASVQSTTGSRVVRISSSDAGYTMFRGRVKSTGYPLHSPRSPINSSPVRHRVPSHFNWSLLPAKMGKTKVTWDATPCRLVNSYEHSEGKQLLLFQSLLSRIHNLRSGKSVFFFIKMNSR